MFFFKQFERFDPVAGDVPGQPFTYLPEIASRARSVLSGWTTDRMVKAAKRINDEIERYYSDLKYVAVEKLRVHLLQIDEDSFEVYFRPNGISSANERWVFRDEMEDILEIPTATNTSEVDALKSIIEDRDCCLLLPESAPEPEVEHWPEGETHQLFAVLSLWLLADAIELAQNGGKFGQSISGEYAIKAMDAVCYAEHLSEVAWLEHWRKKLELDRLREVEGRYGELADRIRRDIEVARFV